MTRSPASRALGLTLVELLVATSLGVILIGIITVVWVQSSRIVTETVERLEVYQNLRNVLDAVERDLANATRTVDMEFWNDKNKNGRFDVTPDERLSVPKSSSSFFRDPRDAGDVLKIAGKREFQDDKLNDVPYFYAPTVSSPVPYMYQRPGSVADAHWRDEVYVRSFTMVGGINRSALVHYRLVGTDLSRPALRRRVWYLNKDAEIAYVAGNPEQSTDRAALVTDGIIDLKVGFLFKESPRQGNEVLYQVRSDSPATEETKSAEIMSLIELDKRFSPCFGTLPSGQPSPLKKTKRPDSSVNAVSFMYEGWLRFEFTEENGLRLRPLQRLFTDDVPATPAPDPFVAGYDTFDFPGIRAGDKIYIFDAADEDAESDATVRATLFPDRYFTVQSVISDSARTSDGVTIDTAGPKAISLQLGEDVDYYRLRPWLKGESVLEAGRYAPKKLTGPDVQGSNVRLPRTVTQAFDARYRVGFLPSAFVVRLSYDDRRHRRVIPFERVIRLLSQ